MNNAMGQLAGLLAIAMLPAVGGLSGVPLSDPAFAAGHTAAMRIGAGLAAAATVVAAVTFGSIRLRRASPRTPARA